MDLNRIIRSRTARRSFRYSGLAKVQKANFRLKPGKWSAPPKKSSYVGSCSLDFSILRMKALNGVGAA